MDTVRECVVCPPGWRRLRPGHPGGYGMVERDLGWDRRDGLATQLPHPETAGSLRRWGMGRPGRRADGRGDLQHPQRGSGLERPNLAHVTPSGLRVGHVDTHSSPTTLNVQANAERVTLTANPAAVTESNSQRATPRCAKFGDQTHSRGVHQNSELSFGVGTPKASACAQDTRLGVPGQRTGRVKSTQGRAGAVQ